MIPAIQRRPRSTLRLSDGNFGLLSGFLGSLFLILCHNVSRACVTKCCICSMLGNRPGASLAVASAPASQNTSSCSVCQRRHEPGHPQDHACREICRSIGKLRRKCSLPFVLHVKLTRKGYTYPRLFDRPIIDTSCTPSVIQCNAARSQRVFPDHPRRTGNCDSRGAGNDIGSILHRTTC